MSSAYKNKTFQSIIVYTIQFYTSMRDYNSTYKLKSMHAIFLHAYSYSISYSKLDTFTV